MKELATCCPECDGSGLEGTVRRLKVIDGKASRVCGVEFCKVCSGKGFIMRNVADVLIAG